MAADLQIVLTADGSNTIYNSEIGESYHSRNGALQESKHVFLNAGLKYFIETKNKKVALTGRDLPAGQAVLEEAAARAVSILEVGFGTGLNFILTADYCLAENISLNYTGIEAYPLRVEMISKTGYEQYITPALWQQFMHNYLTSFQHPALINPNCILQTVQCELQDFHSANKYDIVYFDAFAASRQPEMWSDEAITHTLQFLKPGGVFVTYAITGNLKRCIKGLGLKVEKVPGAPGKREMLRAMSHDL
jgi:tRNA U34 5-methylaminomethyl-2-thiouridine-forming methyltransferase MnmC